MDKTRTVAKCTNNAKERAKCAKFWFFVVEYASA